MRVAALYDIHGNLPALAAVLREVDEAGVDLIVVGGDVVPGPLPRETIERLRALANAVFVRGNADREVVEAFDEPGRIAADEPHPGLRSAAWTAERLDRDARDFLASFAERCVIDIDGLGATLFCHGSPRGDEEILTALTPERRWRPALEGVEEKVVVCGHTHRQFDRRLASWRVLNAGSVGMPYEGRAGAYWLLLGPGVELRRTEYDVKAVAPRLRAGGWFEIEDFLRESFFDPVDPHQTAEFFERQADEPLE